MASKLKTDILETVSGSGTIALTNQLSGMTSASMPSGSVLQVVNAVMTTPTAAAVSGWYDITDLVATITPISTSSKILIQANVFGSVSNAGWLTAIRIKRGATVIGVGTGSNTTHSTAGISWMTNTYGGKTMSTSYLDSPATSNSTTYQVQYYGGNTGVTTYIGREQESTNWATSCTLTIMEIKG
tara:strand:- start:1130 stop:1684 length:555 start_codon:yes stop_codon:yes gene_type:complete